MHKRQQIREVIRDTLQAVPTLSGRVSTTRTRPTGADELPAVIIYTLREESAHADVRRTLSRTATVLVEVRAAATDDLDDKLDDLCLEVENALAADHTLGRIAQTSFLAGTTIGLDGEGETRNAVASLEYQVTYRTTPGAAGA